MENMDIGYSFSHAMSLWWLMTELHVALASSMKTEPSTKNCNRSGWKNSVIIGRLLHISKIHNNGCKSVFRLCIFSTPNPSLLDCPTARWDVRASDNFAINMYHIFLDHWNKRYSKRNAPFINCHKLSRGMSLFLPKRYMESTKTLLILLVWTWPLIWNWCDDENSLQIYCMLKIFHYY